MDMFKEYGITKQSIYDVLDDFNISYDIHSTTTDDIRKNLAEVLFKIDNGLIDFEKDTNTGYNYSGDDLFEIIAVCELIDENGQTLEDFRK